MSYGFDITALGETVVFECCHACGKRLGPETPTDYWSAVAYGHGVGTPTRHVVCVACAKNHKIWRGWLYWGVVAFNFGAGIFNALLVFARFRGG